MVAPEQNEADWDSFVDAHPAATGYHRWAWRRVFEGAFGHETVYLAAREHGRIVGVLPLVVFRRSWFGTFVVSLPFVNYGGVLASDRIVAKRLLEAAAALTCQFRASHLELRHRARAFPDLPVKSHKVAMLMPLASDVEAAWNALDRKVRNQIRKAEKSGLRASVGGADRVADFYRVFAENMRDLGTPVYPRRLFEQVVEQFPREARVVIVTQGGTPVAGGIGCGYRDTVEVPWASSLKAFRSFCPNNLLYWTLIQQAIADGYKVFDFGRSTPGEGTYHFKVQWGARPEPLYWEYRLIARADIPDQSPKNPKFRAAIALWKRLPVRLTTLLGPSIVRSIP